MDPGFVALVPPLIRPLVELKTPPLRVADPHHAAQRRPSPAPAFPEARRDQAGHDLRRFLNRVQIEVALLRDEGQVGAKRFAGPGRLKN